MTSNKGLLRANVAQIISAVVVQGHALPDTITKFTSDRPQDKATSQFICYGLLRSYEIYEDRLNALLEKPLRTKEHLIKHLLLSALFQHAESRMPKHAIVHDTVAALSHLKKSWAKSFVNALLRRATAKDIPSKSNPTTSSNWLLKKIQSLYPQEWPVLSQTHLTQPPMTLRVNQTKISRSDYLTHLEPNSYELTKYSPVGVTLHEARDVTACPGFEEGWVSVQDQAGQLLPSCLSLSSGMRILDACSAPGSKTCHCLETVPTLDCLSLDISDTRLMKLKENASRLSLSVNTRCTDATQIADWYDGNTFDCILLDAPCSGSGVIRRHPDIKFCRQPSDMPKLVETQLALLNTLWSTLAAGGQLLYSTCSIFPEENERVIEKFLMSRNNGQHIPLNTAWGRVCQFGRQILPGYEDMDGFYYALLLKTTD